MPAARILVVDDDETILQLVADTLTREGYIISSAVSPRAALARAAQVGAFHLVVSDVHLPEMNGFQMRDAIRKLDGHERTPFLFMSAGYEAVESDIATMLGDAPLLLKPFSRADLRRMVYKALKFVRVVVGPIPGQLDRVFEDVADSQGTGILTAVDGATVKRVVFQDGKAVFAASNDPRDLIGQAYIRAGLISEKELLAALGKKAEPVQTAGRPVPLLAGALAALRKVTPEQSAAVFQQKTRESILDLYLWSKGALEYSEGNVTDADLPFPISLELQSIRREGAARRMRWAHVTELFADRDIAFARTGRPMPSGFPRSGGERALVQLVDEGRTLAEIFLEMRGQDYAVGMRLASLLERDVIRTGPARGFRGPREDTGDIKLDEEFESMFSELASELNDPPGGAPVVAAAPIPVSAPLGEPSMPRQSETLSATATVFAAALVKMRSGDLAGARIGLERVLSLDPMSALARTRLQEVDLALVAKSRGAARLEDGRELTLAVGLQALVGRQMSPPDAFVLSRLAAGTVTVGSLIKLCPFPAHEVLGILERHLAAGVIR